MIKIIITISLLLTLNPNLFPQWSTDPNNNLIVGYGQDPHICSDSAGGCYITYTYETTWYPQKLAVERLDLYGYKPWGTLKQILGELPEQWQAEIVEDGEGGVIVSYQDNQVIGGTDFTSRVRVQRVDSNGNFLWGPIGVKVTTEETNHGGQHLVNDGEGGCTILWQNYNGVYNINHITELGERNWGDSGKVIGISAFSDDVSLITSSDRNYYVQTGEYIYRISQNGEIVRRDSVTLGYIVPDPEGGIVLSGRVWTGMIPKLVAQRKDSLGNNLWQEPYVEIADSLYINTVLIIQKNDGYFYYGWSGKKNGIDRVAQYQALRLDGSKLFSQESISISDHTPLAISGIFPSDSNKMIFIWSNRPSLPDTTLAQMYDTLGNKLWTENGIVLAHPSIGHQTYATDGNGGFIIGGTVDQFTIVAQQVNKYGELGEILTDVYIEEDYITPTETALFQNYPNPFNSTTNIKCQLQKEGRIRIVLYNILGEELKILVDEYKTSGTYMLTFNSNELPSGVYLYTLETGLHLLVKKLTILK